MRSRRKKSSFTVQYSAMPKQAKPVGLVVIRSSPGQRALGDWHEDEKSRLASHSQWRVNSKSHVEMNFIDAIQNRETEALFFGMTTRSAS
jgi:hypothetical protein